MHTCVKPGNKVGTERMFSYKNTTRYTFFGSDFTLATLRHFNILKKLIFQYNAKIFLYTESDTQ